MTREIGKLRQSTTGAVGSIERESQKFSEQARTSAAEVTQLAAQATGGMTGAFQKIAELKEMSRSFRTVAEETQAAVALTHAEVTQTRQDTLDIMASECNKFALKSNQTTAECYIRIKWCIPDAGEHKARGYL